MNDDSNQNKKSSNARGKTIFLVILSIVFIGLAILIWANQTGKISLWASTTRTVTNNNLTAVTTCANGMQTDTLRVNPGIGISNCNCTYYTRLGNSAEWSTISRCQNLLRDQQCVWGPADSLSRSYSAQCNCTGGQRHGPVQVASCSVSPTASPAPTATPSTSCIVSSTDPGVCTQAFTLNLNQNCNNKTNQLTWNLGSNPWDKYEWVTIQRRTGSGTFTLGSPQINQRPITSTWPCNSSGQCSHADTFSDGSTNYTYRVYVKNKADGKTYRSYEAYANSCSNTPTPTISPTSGQCTPGQNICQGDYACTCNSQGNLGCPKSTCSMLDPNTKCQNGVCVPVSISIILDQITSICTTSNLSDVGQQINSLKWSKATGAYSYSPMVKSSKTNNKYTEIAAIYNENTTTHDHSYPSYNDVYYRIVAKNSQGTMFPSNDIQAIPANCSPSPSPTQQPTPSPSDKVNLKKLTCTTNSDGTENLNFDFSTTLNEPLEITAAFEATYKTGPASVIGQKYWKALWGSGVTGSINKGDQSTTSISLSNVDPNLKLYADKNYPAKWRIMLWPSRDPSEIYYSNESDCSGVMPAPQAPTNLTAQAISNSEIKLSWTGSIDSGAGYYKIYNADTKSLIKTVESSITNINIDGLQCETEYKYYVAAGVEALESDPSNITSVTTGSCSTGNDISDKKPENIRLEYMGNGLANLSWGLVDGATGYNIYQCNGDYLVSTAQNSYSFTGNNCGQTLCYYVIAHNDSSESQKSDEASVNTEKCGGGGSDTPSTPSVTKLISTGASLWFNILIALLLTFGIGYFMFRNKIHDNQ